VGRNNEVNLSVSILTFKNGRLYFRKKVRIIRRRRTGMVKHTAAEEKRLRVIAREVVVQKVEQFNQYYKFEYGKIFIKNQRTRWGSCSSKKNLNFNYRIALLPAELQDYLVVHELCHLQEFNHGKKFWDLVGGQIPGYKELDKRLKTFQFLHVV
jgi:predicted metal-dependent hydrolase